MATKKKMTPAEQQAFEKGKLKGIEIGREEGVTAGYKDGIKEGSEEGFAKGRTKGFEEAKEKYYEKGRRIGLSEGKKIGSEKTYPIAHKDGEDHRLLEMCSKIEEKMAEAAGFKDRETWRLEGTIPAWWIAVYMSFWQDSITDTKKVEEDEEEFE